MQDPWIQESTLSSSASLRLELINIYGYRNRIERNLNTVDVCCLLSICVTLAQTSLLSSRLPIQQPIWLWLRCLKRQAWDWTHDFPFRTIPFYDFSVSINVPLPNCSSQKPMCYPWFPIPLQCPNPFFNPFFPSPNHLLPFTSTTNPLIQS